MQTFVPLLFLRWHWIWSSSYEGLQEGEPLDENGFQQVLKGGERAAMEAFIRHIDGKGEELHLFVLKKGVGMPARKSEIVWKTLSKDHV